jgi:aconitate hydratase 2 / 2-methylisocitrate dehydratase
MLTVAKQGKKNIFSGRILEIEGLPELKVEQAFELSDASAERSAAGCSVHLNKEPIIEYLNSNVTLLKWMIAQGYQDPRSLQRRIAAMEQWLADPQLLSPDADAEYAAVIEIDLADIHEPIVACPNDPDDVKTLSDVAGAKIDEVFIGSCMTNIGHFRAASKLLEGKRDIPVKLWVAPPTKMDQKQLTEEGHYGVFGTAGVPWLGGTGGDLLTSGQDSNQGRVHGRHGRAQRRRRQDLQVHELRPDRRLQGSCRHGEYVSGLLGYGVMFSS